MASSNRHWPSMFKTKPCYTHHLHWQQDINSSSLVSNGSHKAPHTAGGEERTPEPKPRWNPRPEQIRILEAIFNSGMVNPPRDEIRKIRAQLQVYGQVGDANVFYWFQNRKSRSKHKLRQLQNKAQQNQQNPSSKKSISTTSMMTLPSSSSSSSDKSSQNSADKSFSACSKNVIDLTNSPTASVNNSLFQAHNEFHQDPFFNFPVQQTTSGPNTTSFTQGFSFADTSNATQVIDQAVASFPSLTFSDLQALMMNHGIHKKVDDQKMKLQQEQLSYPFTTAPTTTTQSIVPPTSFPIPSTVHQLQGGYECGDMYATKSTVFINDVAFDVAVGPFNVKESFGDDAMLVHSSGLPVLTNEWGVTLQPLQHGASYFLLRTFTPSSLDNTFDLI